MEQQPSGNNTLKGFSAAIVAAVCYGTNPLGTLKLYEDGFNSGTVLSYRYGLAVLMFALVMLIRKESFAIKWGHAIKFALLGTFFALSSITLYVTLHGSRHREHPALRLPHHDSLADDGFLP